MTQSNGTDVYVRFEGSLVTFELLTQGAKSWVRECVDQESHNWLTKTILAVETRYADDISRGMQESGLTLT
jgi:hypothetical protein